MTDDDDFISELSDEERKEFIKDRRATQVLINTANTIDNADGNVLSALYTPLQDNLGFNTEQLGAITTARALLQAVSTPVWGWLGDRFSRKVILAIGCLIWGVFTVILGFLSNFWGMLFVRAFTGLGLAVIFPTAQSLVADYFPKSKRGQAFGMLGLTTVLGAIVGTLYATLFSETTVLGYPGWRFVFITVGAFSLILGVFVWIFGRDPKRGISDKNVEVDDETLSEEEKKAKRKFRWEDYKTILTNKTFVLIVLQGIAGTIPWNSMLFIVFWLEEIGFDAFLAGIAFSMVAIGAAFGNLFGGFIGDKAAKWKPDHGRLIVAQISVFSGIPMMVVLFYVVPNFVLGSLNLNQLLGLFIALGIVTGFFISWSAPATNNPIFSELFDTKIRSSAFAVDRLFEGSIAASGTYFVALFANRVFGYIDTEAAKGSIGNILALSNSMLVCTIAPWVICLAVYTFIYFTYPKDRDAVNTTQAAKKETIEEEKIA